MKKLHIYFFFIFLFTKVPAFSQNETRLDRLTHAICENMHADISSLRDGQPFYGFSLELELRKVGNRVSVVRVEANDSIGYVIVKDLSFLKKYNYDFLMKNSNRKIVIIPVAAIPYHSDTTIKPKSLKIKAFNQNINNLFQRRLNENPNTPTIITNPIIVHTNRKNAAKIHTVPSSLAQQPDSLQAEIFKCVSINHEILKDSIAFYSLALKIEVSRKNGKIVVDTAYHNYPIKNLVSFNYECLRSYNFGESISGLKKAIFVIPVSLLIHNNSRPAAEQKIHFRNMQFAIESLFGADAEAKFSRDNWIYFRPLIIYADKGVYD